MFFISLLLACSCLLSAADTLFQDGFESGSFGAEWSITGTNQARAQISTENEPAIGTNHLVLDDSVDDSTYSASEATLTLDLTTKKNVILKFQAKSLGNELDLPPPSGSFTTQRNYDGIAISMDGGVTWRSVAWFNSLNSSWKNYSIPLDNYIGPPGSSYGPNSRIRFSCYVNSPVPIDGIAIDDVSVTADDDHRLIVEIPTPIVENAGPYTGNIRLTIPEPSPLTVALITSPANQVTLPSNITIPAGQTQQSFTFDVSGDDLVSPVRNITLSASATGLTTGSANLVIQDDERAHSTLTLPAELIEGETPSNNATLTIDRAASVPLVFNLTGNSISQLSIPSSITIPAGQTSVSFNVWARNDTNIDGDIPVTVTATTSNSSVSIVNAQTLAIDNENRALTLALPTTQFEGSSFNATVSISGKLPQALDITIATTESPEISAPIIVTIPAGQVSATIPVTIADNGLRDGSRTVSITATSTGFVSSSKVLTIRDNELAGYHFDALADIVNISNPVAITVSGTDCEGNILPDIDTNVTLSVILPDGSTQPLQPNSVTLSDSTGFSGNVTFPMIATAPLRLRATDTYGNVGESSPFDIMRLLPFTAGDLLWDKNRDVIYASVPLNASGEHANKVIAINPQSLNIISSVSTSQNPGQLALTNEGGYLYTALNANGSIARISLDTFSIDSTFPIGTSTDIPTSGELLYAEDIAAVAGEPNLLVVSRHRKGISPGHENVAVYDNGIARPSKTASHIPNNLIEPTTDPTIFFGENTQGSVHDSHKLKIDSNGITLQQHGGDLLHGGNNMRSDGDQIFAQGGYVADSVRMARIGSFNTIGMVCPDLAANRVYYLEESNRLPNSTLRKFDQISIYDPNTFIKINTLSLPASYDSDDVKSFIRWGANGLAFRSADSIVLINSSQLIPSESPANLDVVVQASPNPVSAGLPLTYTMQVTNHGPNIANNTVLSFLLSEGQNFFQAEASIGTPAVSGSSITTSVGDLTVGATATLTIKTTPQSAGSLTCTGSASSSSIDPDTSNNVDHQKIAATFHSELDVVNELRVSANNLIFDPTRQLLWATIPGSVTAPLENYIVSINPRTGLMSSLLWINSRPYPGSMALAANGRYLYVGLDGVSEVHRLDLTDNTSMRIALSPTKEGDANYAQDIEVLDGDGTSFLMTGWRDEVAAIYDNNVRRTIITPVYTADRIERTTTPGTFIGYNNSTSGNPIHHLTVTSNGVIVSKSVSNILYGNYTSDIRADGNLLVSTIGRVIDPATLTLRFDLGILGRPVADSRYDRVYLVNGNMIRGYNASTGTSIGNLPLPTTNTGDWAKNCIRWGADGFAVLGSDKIYITRWSASIPTDADYNLDDIADSWAARNFGVLDVDLFADTDGDTIPNALEYLFGSNPRQSDPSPLLSSVDEDSQLHITFPRRSGVGAEAYVFETSDDLSEWHPATGVTASILSTQTIDGATTQIIDARIPATSPGRNFARLKWLKR